MTTENVIQIYKIDEENFWMGGEHNEAANAQKRQQ